MTPQSRPNEAGREGTPLSSECGIYKTVKDKCGTYKTVEDTNVAHKTYNAQSRAAEGTDPGKRV